VIAFPRWAAFIIDMSGAPPDEGSPRLVAGRDSERMSFRQGQPAAVPAAPLNAYRSRSGTTCAASPSRIRSRTAATSSAA
jgi:hypothetical protein